MPPIDYKKLGPAVQNGRIKYLSVSSVQKFDPSGFGGCPTRWYRHYILGDKEEKTKSQDAGTEGHRQLAHLVKTGQDLLDNITRPARALLPEVLPDPRVQAEIQIATQNGATLKSFLNAAGIPFVGEIDVLDLRSLSTGLVQCVDHKFTGRKPEDIEKGSKINETIQMTGYGSALAEMYPQANVIKLTHNYIGLRKRYAFATGETEATKNIRARWESRVVPLVERMKSVASETDIEKVGKNENSCHAWNKPCKYVTKCFPDPIEQLVKLGSKKEETQMPNILQTLKKSSASTLPANVSTNPEKIDTSKLPPPGGMGVSGPFYTVQQQDIYGIDENGNPRKKLVIEEVQSVLPPDAPKSNPAIAAQPPPEGEPLPAGVAEKVAALPAEKPKRGRPAKAKVSDAPAQASAPAAGEPGPVSQSTAALTEIPPAPSGPHGGIIIAVDTIAPGVQSLTPFVDSVVNKLTIAANAVDVRTIRDKDSPLAFGGWKGVLAALAKKDPPAPGVYSVASNEFVDAILEGLESKATIIRGRR